MNSIQSLLSPRREGLLDLLAWALADNSHPKAWWCGRLGLDEGDLEELLAGETERLLRARMLRAVGENSGSRDVSRAVRARVVEILAGTPKAAVLASIGITLKRLPEWIVEEWQRTPSLAGLNLLPAPPGDFGGIGELPDGADLRAAIEEAKKLIEGLNDDR